jgi:hypothetical protein
VRVVGQVILGWGRGRRRHRDKTKDQQNQGGADDPEKHGPELSDGGSGEQGEQCHSAGRAGKS